MDLICLGMCLCMIVEGTLCVFLIPCEEITFFRSFCTLLAWVALKYLQYLKHFMHILNDVLIFSPFFFLPFGKCCCAWYLFHATKYNMSWWLWRVLRSYNLEDSLKLVWIGMLLVPTFMGMFVISHMCFTYSIISSLLHTLPF
jgi:hypothetical protein